MRLMVWRLVSHQKRTSFVRLSCRLGCCVEVLALAEEHELEI